MKIFFKFKDNGKTHQRVFGYIPYDAICLLLNIIQSAIGKVTGVHELYIYSTFSMSVFVSSDIAYSKTLLNNQNIIMDIASYQL